jgi:hypothetical protein
MSVVFWPEADFTLPSNIWFRGPISGLKASIVVQCNETSASDREDRRVLPRLIFVQSQFY